MSETQAFRDLLAKVRAGDQQSAAELIGQYDAELRRAVRVRLTDPRLRRVVDTADVCQSVLAQFFVRVAAGEFDLERPEQLLHLLVRMARNKLLDKVRRQQADKRDQRRIEAGAVPMDEIAGNAPGPDRIVASQDLLQTVRRLLTDDERKLADKRGQGREWNDIAKEMGSQPDAIRKKLSRGLDRVLAQLGIDGVDDE